MTKCLRVLGICVWICTEFAFAVDAAPNPNLTLQIVPLECSFDTTAIGQTTSQQITPEECRPLSVQIDQPEVMGGNAAPVTSPTLTTPATYYTTQIGTGSNISNMPQITKDAPEVRGVKATTDGKHANEESNSLVLHPVAAALLITVVAIIPTGSISPIVSQVGAIRLRFPWVK